MNSNYVLIYRMPDNKFAFSTHYSQYCEPLGRQNERLRKIIEGMDEIHIKNNGVKIKGLELDKIEFVGDFNDYRVLWSYKRDNGYFFVESPWIERDKHLTALKRLTKSMGIYDKMIE